MRDKGFRAENARFVTWAYLSQSSSVVVRMSFHGKDGRNLSVVGGPHAQPISVSSDLEHHDSAVEYLAGGVSIPELVRISEWHFF